MSNVLDNGLFTYKDQKVLLKKLFAVEKKFKETMLATASGKSSYKNFMKFILCEKRNILAARIYFRERQNTFSNKIAKAFHQNKPERLFKFRINYVFASWVCNNMKVKNKRLDKLLEEIKLLRNRLCETNLPLAINRTKIFWSKIPEGHLEYMDLIQASSEGLLIAIDKFVPPFKLVFRSVAIGRMVAYMIEDNSETVIKLSPTERRILYLINKAKNNRLGSSEDSILNAVRETFPKVTKEYINELINASKVLNLDIPAGNSHDSTDKTNNYKNNKKDTEMYLNPSNDIEEEIVNNDLKNKLIPASRDLSVIEKKVLSLTYGLNLLKE